MDVYDFRLASTALLERSAVEYAVMLLSGSINPFIMAWGIINKKIAIFLIGALGQVFLYSTEANKSILLSILLILLFYFILRGKPIYFGLKLVWGTFVFLACLMLINIILGPEFGSLFNMLSSIVFMRTFGMTGLLSGQYHDFFQNHPLTYYSHIKGVNLFLQYPYQKPLGLEVGYYYSGNLDLNENAHFWATDGLAALGLTGIILVSLLCFMLFWLSDSLLVRHKPVFAALAISYAALNISNASLFTSLLSGGLGCSILLLYLLPPNVKNIAYTKTARGYGSQFNGATM
jgi:hypothetical protein